MTHSYIPSFTKLAMMGVAVACVYVLQLIPAVGGAVGPQFAAFIDQILPIARQAFTS